MKSPSFGELTMVVVCCSIILVLGMYLLVRFNSLFRKQISNEVLRKNIMVCLIANCLIISVSPTTIDFYSAYVAGHVLNFYLLDCIGITVEAIIIFNLARAILKKLNARNVSFTKKMTAVFCTIVISTMLLSVPLNFLGNKFMRSKPSLDYVQLSILFSFYTGCMTGLVYIAMSYVDMDRKRKLNEKELELSHLRELKTKAELDALHSKINPHFLYNALNSIADLSVTDGRKARKMTIALADLFRYSINYSNHNYSTVKEEIEMAEVYLAIEKIRFEDQLTYSIQSNGGADHFLVPRFLLQPVVENAVKHGLKATGKMTEIKITIDKGENCIQILVADNGPDFPDDLVPGYGVKSLYDKLDLLFPDMYHILFQNTPEKKLVIHINNS